MAGLVGEQGCGWKEQVSVQILPYRHFLETIQHPGGQPNFLAGNNPPLKNPPPRFFLPAADRC